MHNYKALKAAGKSSVKKQEAAAAVYNDDGSIKTQEVREELQVVCKSFNPQTGEAQDDSVRAYSLSEVKREVDSCKADVVRIEAEQAEWEQIETDLKAL
jgi:hypothetical protein